MSIASEITRISGNVADAYTAANAKGATMPVTQNSDNLATTISTIQTGTTPTGTKNITSNGVYDVTDFASADVQVPTTAPAYYIEKAVDSNGVMTNTSSNILNFSGVTEIGANCLYYAYYNNNNISGILNLSDIITIQTYGFSYCFYKCTGITGVDLSSLTTIKDYGCGDMFRDCTSLTSADLSSLTFNNTNSQYGCQRMFSGCTGLTNIKLNFVYITSSSGSVCLSMFNNCTGLLSADMSSLIRTTAYNGFSNAFYGCTSLTTVDLSSLTILDATSGSCPNMFYGCINLSSVNISRLAKISGTNNLQQMFRNCTSLTELRFSGLPYTASNFNDSFQNMLQGVTGCTVHFPAEWQTAMSSWSNITAGFGGTNTTVLFDLPNVTTMDLSYVVSVPQNSLFYLFLGTSSGSGYFPNITKVNLCNLTSVSGSNSFEAFCDHCSDITSVDLSSLKIISGSWGFRYAFRQCSSLTSISFPALKTVANANVFNSLITGTSNVTIHFPSNFATTVTDSTVGGTNTTVLYDLPAVVVLTGADTVEYERNPKYDSATALAWRVNGTEPDTTTYYTSGLTDPTVGTTIYSDSACTVTETTVASIA